MTTTVYDTHVMSSDSAFTEMSTGIVTLEIQFQKVKRVDSIVVGMAGCLRGMIDFWDSILDFVQQKTTHPEFPSSILQRKSEFLAMICFEEQCYKYHLPKDSEELMFGNITNVPTVIGSGGKHISSVLEDCPNAVVAVLEAIKRDAYTKGDVKYCSIRLEGIHNLEIRPMNTLQQQITGLQQELAATNDFLGKAENEGKVFHACTDVYHQGTPTPVTKEDAMSFLAKALGSVREKLNASNQSQ